MKIKIVNFLIFLPLAYSSAFMFENVPRFIWKEIFKVRIEGYLWEIPGWPWFVLVWYTLIFSVSYLIFLRKGIKWVVVSGIAIGTLAETLLFKKMNLISFFLFPFLYGGMFYLPFKVFEVLKNHCICIKR